MQQPVLAVDANHMVSYANPSAAAVMGYDCPSELVGINGKPAERSYGEGTLTHADGSLIPVTWSLLSLALPGCEASVYVFRTGADREGRLSPVVSSVNVDQQRRVADSLQHGAQERLVGVLLGLKLGREQLGREPSLVAELIDGSIRDAEDALAQIRDVTAHTYPGVLKRRGLPTALAALGAICSVPVAFSGNLDVRLPDAVELHTYFLIAEALRRAVHSARAGRVEVVTDLDSDLVVTVMDDGDGPDRRRHASLVAMADRVSVLGGTLTVNDESDSGTTVRAVIPVRLRTADAVTWCDARCSH
ncbi:histidine kinase [Streptomyces sp. NPDC001530]|uniref:sensor histidine kinase n=1 Tax=Streptomyces sp. NPDC001530 TaxID=3364582 RepID=UPI00367FB0CD